MAFDRRLTVADRICYFVIFLGVLAILFGADANWYRQTDWTNVSPAGIAPSGDAQ